VSWYRKAAEQGYARAYNNLGTMYALGQGVPLDYVQAHKWFGLASSPDDGSEKESRETAVKNRDIVAARMTPAQIAEAQKLAREWKPKPDGSRQ
jgi:TPR repeat protein